MDCKDKWYEHTPERVAQNDGVKILWDFGIQTDHRIEPNRPDLVVVDKDQSVCQLIDVAIPGDAKVESKEKEKIKKYQDLARKIKKMWNVKTTVIPIVIGALGAIAKGLEGHQMKEGLE